MSQDKKKINKKGQTNGNPITHPECKKVIEITKKAG
jgi:hypothetical protein